MVRGLALLALLSATALPAAGQAVTGRVFDGASGQPVDGAEVAILSAEAGPVGLGVSDSAGAFHIPLGEPGSYRLVATAVGYDSLAVDSVAVAEAEDVWVELRLGPRPFDVEGLTVVARRPMGPPELREYFRRLDRYRDYGGSGVVLDREALDELIGETGTTALARASIHAREVVGLGRSLQLKRRGVPTTLNRWCTPAFYLDGLRVDGSTIASIPASDLMGVEMYRSITEIPAQFMAGRSATNCGVVLAWTRRGGGRPLHGEPRPFRVGVFAAGSDSDRPDGSVDLAAVGIELERGMARSMSGWVQIGLTRPRFGTICAPGSGGDCGVREAPWSVVVGASLFPTGTELPVAPYLGGGLGLASPESGIERTHLIRAGVELVPGPVHLRVEVRRDPNAWGLAVGVMF